MLRGTNWQAHLSESKDVMRWRKLWLSLILGWVTVVLQAQMLAAQGGPLIVKDPGETRHTPADDPRLVIEAGGHQAIIRKLLFTADGRELLSVSDDKTIRVWSVSPDGRQAALA